MHSIGRIAELFTGRRRGGILVREQDAAVLLDVNGQIDRVLVAYDRAGSVAEVDVKVDGEFGRIRDLGFADEFGAVATTTTRSAICGCLKDEQFNHASSRQIGLAFRLNGSFQLSNE